LIGLDSLSENPNHHPQKERTLQSGDAFIGIDFKLEFEIVKI
jgi:hypothetical protein